MNRADLREAFVGENGLDAAQRAALMALSPRDLPAQASSSPQVCASHSDPMQAAKL